MESSHQDTPTPQDDRRLGWTFLSNHAHVLVELARDSGIRLRDIAAHVGITERAVHRIVAELVDAGVLTRERVGRRNHYTIACERHLRHPVESHCTIGDLLEMVGGVETLSEDRQG